MKREARNHSKMRRLCRRLDIPLYQAVGILECLWHLTAVEAWRGDIGKLTDEDIAIALDYRGDEAHLIEELLYARWLDRSETHRLLVHDWSEHADNAVQKRAKRAEESGQIGFYQEKSRHVQTFPEHVQTSPAVSSLPEPEPEPGPEPGAREATAPASPIAGKIASPFEWPSLEAEPPNSAGNDEEQTIPDDLPPAALGNFLLQQLSIPHSRGLASKFANCVDLLARDERRPRGEAARELLKRARERPPGNGKWPFWLDDGQWKLGPNGKPAAADPLAKLRFANPGGAR